MELRMSKQVVLKRETRASVDRLAGEVSIVTVSGAAV